MAISLTCRFAASRLCHVRVICRSRVQPPRLAVTNAKAERSTPRFDVHIFDDAFRPSERGLLAGQQRGIAISLHKRLERVVTSGVERGRSPRCAIQRMGRKQRHASEPTLRHGHGGGMVAAVRQQPRKDMGVRAFR